MYECEKCIHEEVCDQASRRLWGTLRGEKVCSDFKGRDKYVEVVHGKWEKAEYNGFLRCDQCKDVYINEEWLEDGKWNYCPNCGAKMDGDDNDST